MGHDRGCSCGNERSEYGACYDLKGGRCSRAGVVKKWRRGREDDTDLASRLNLLRDALDRAGLHKTARKMDEPIRQIGYEIAEHVEAGKIDVLPD